MELSATIHLQTLQDLARRLSFDERRASATPALAAWVSARRPLPPHAAFLEERYGHETYRLALSLLAGDLEEASRDDMTTRLLSQTPHVARARVKDVASPLAEIAASLPLPATAHPGLSFSDVPSLAQVQQQLDIFGLHAARLDLREDSSRLRSALSEILRALGWAQDFDRLAAGEQIDLLVGWLAAPRPPGLSHRAGVTGGRANRDAARAVGRVPARTADRAAVRDDR